MNLIEVQINGVRHPVPPGLTVAAALALLDEAGLTRRSVSGQARAPLCGMGVCQECRVSIDGQWRLACQTPCREGQQIVTLDAGPHAPVPTPAPAVACPATSPARAVTVAPTCDLLIIGAGPAGLAAAAAAAPSGAHIVIADDNPAAGGQVWRQGPGHAADPELRKLLDSLSRQAKVELASGFRVAAFADLAPAAFDDTSTRDTELPALLLESEAGARWQPARRLLLATGARELLLPFPGWTLPGVTGAGGLQALVKGGLEVRGQRIVLAGSGPLLLASAATLSAAGAKVLRIAEQAAFAAAARFAAGLARWPGKLGQALVMAPANTRWRAGAWVTAAHGDAKLRRVRLRRADGGGEELIECERLGCGFGLVPNTELGRALGCATQAGAGPNAALAVDASARTSRPHVYAAGECTGIGGNERARVQGTIAGLAAIGDTAGVQALQPVLARWQGFADAVHSAFALRAELRTLAHDDTLTCRCEDVPHQRMRAEGGWVAAKLATRCGMGPCQGRICGAAAQWLYGWGAPPAARHLINPTRIESLL